MASQRWTTLFGQISFSLPEEIVRTQMGTHVCFEDFHRSGYCQDLIETRKIFKARVINFDNKSLRSRAKLSCTEMGSGLFPDYLRSLTL